MSKFKRLPLNFSCYMYVSLFWGIVFVNQSVCLSVTKVCTCNSSYILNGNSLKRNKHAVLSYGDPHTMYCYSIICCIMIRFSLKELFPFWLIIYNEVDFFGSSSRNTDNTHILNLYLTDIKPCCCLKISPFLNPLCFI